MNAHLQGIGSEKIERQAQGRPDVWRLTRPVISHWRTKVVRKEPDDVAKSLRTR
jgi:hypothetical protein